ncbi:MAG: YicC family protein [candidate division NC10 bacterium]|nr:YicC family protein [candidate division NC10 bacterium]
MRDSMTGFGRGEAAAAGRAYRLEVYAVNHRFLEVRCRLPRRLQALEPKLQQAVKGRFARGHFEVSVQEKDLGGGTRRLAVDAALAREYVELLGRLQRELGLPGEVTLGLVASQRDLIVVEEAEAPVEEAWAALLPALEAALDELAAMRRREGEALVAALARELSAIEGGVARILQRAPEAVQAQRERLRERIAELLAGRELDPGRLEQEVAILADRGDVTEECDRLRSHLGQFRATLAQAGPQGRRLEFLLQEMGREANTTGSKSADAQLAHEVVELKAALERLREQVQNLE